MRSLSKRVADLIGRTRFITYDDERYVQTTNRMDANGGRTLAWKELIAPDHVGVGV